MSLEANRDFKTSWTMRYEGPELRAHLMKRGQGIDRKVTIEEMHRLEDSPIIFPPLDRSPNN